MTDEAHAVRALVEQFRRMVDPAADPEAAIRDQLEKFLSAYLEDKGSEGGDLEEGEARLLTAAARDPAHWRTGPDRLRVLWRETFKGPERLPPLSPPAQLVWLGSEQQHRGEIIDQALFRQFPALTPPDIAAAWREVSLLYKGEQLAREMELAVFMAWAGVHKARGRAENELILGNRRDELRLVEQREDGRQYLNFNNLARVTDQELRHACLAAAWKSQQESNSEAAP